MSKTADDISTKFSPEGYYKTVNARGEMHPTSLFSQVFIADSTDRVVADLGCAYGSVAIACAFAGAKKVFACDMESKHIEAVEKQAEAKALTNIKTQQVVLPSNISFPSNYLDAIHASHILEYLSGIEVETAIAQCFNWLKPEGKLFLQTYSIYIKELANEKFHTEYTARKMKGENWPGFFEDYNSVCTEEEPEDIAEQKIDATMFPSSLHMFEVEILRTALERAGFEIISARYVDGQSSHAVEETWLDGRELIGIIAKKPAAL